MLSYTLTFLKFYRVRVRFSLISSNKLCFKHSNLSFQCLLYQLWVCVFTLPKFWHHWGEIIMRVMERELYSHELYSHELYSHKMYIHIYYTYICSWVGFRVTFKFLLRFQEFSTPSTPWIMYIIMAIQVKVGHKMKLKNTYSWRDRELFFIDWMFSKYQQDIIKPKHIQSFIFYSRSWTACPSVSLCGIIQIHPITCQLCKFMLYFNWNLLTQVLRIWWKILY